MNKFDLYVKSQNGRVEALRSQLTTSAKEAKLRNDTHYIGLCKLHGEKLFLSCDNTCPVCCWVAPRNSK